MLNLSEELKSLVSEVKETPMGKTAIKMSDNFNEFLGFSNSTAKEGEGPTQEELDKAKTISWGGVALRDKYPNDPKAQGLEHGQYVEQILDDNPSLVPILAPLGAVAINAYQIGKLTAGGRELLKTGTNAASSPSFEQMKGGYEGLGRGLQKYASRQFMEFLGVKIVDEKKAP